MTEPANSTSLLGQYAGVKERYPGHLVLIRVGDFFEGFGDDAKLLSRELEIVLTARAADSSGERLPMAGVPHHALETYLGRLVRKGYKVAICDQVEDARLAKGLVRREVTRVVTPGTVVEDRILPGADHNFLASLDLPDGAPGAFAVVDITTGEWFDGVASSAGIEPLLAELASFAPREIVFAAAPAVESALRAGLKREFPAARLELAAAVPAGIAIPPSVTPPPNAPTAALTAATNLAAYVRATQPRLLSSLERIAFAGSDRRLALDARTLRHLEITRPMNPDDPGGATLLSSWDETVTAPGRRTLSLWLRRPLADLPAIRSRQDAVEVMVAQGAALLGLRSELRTFADLARIASRMASRHVHPPELAALRTSLEAVGRLRAWVERAPAGELRRLHDVLVVPEGVFERLAAAVPNAPPPTVDSGGLIRPGFSPALDALTRAEADGLVALEALERREQDGTGIRTLRVAYNSVFGYYIEVTRPHLAKVPGRYRRKQTVAQGERFTTDELAQIEETILTARERRTGAEAEIWEQLLAELDEFVPALHRLSRAVGELDTLATFALLAQERGYVRPTVDDSRALQIRDGRHPVLDRTLSGQFVPNDTDLDAAGTRLVVLTGPNMSGKSTYMRQVGLLVVLAQVGAFVPARVARIGLVSGLYTRMGFTDEIGRGKSSFMVEMSEVADILRSADDRSLVLLDEVGRGTSTFDGLALAWATLRHLHDQLGCRTILATHYHQLTELIQALPGATSSHLAVRETGQDVVFLHRLVPGSTDRSYGLHVARLAGLPPELVGEAERLLRSLEASGVSLPGRGRRAAPTRYTQAVLLTSETPGAPSAAEAALRSVDPERMTPMEALQFVTEWRRRLMAERPDGGA
ncbi:MAG: DNA mismatch repair protein MutS [Thermoplasmata archaeon]|nr:DNA mismatch repair protein MutS [Thermoplasmata archaeon]